MFFLTSHGLSAICVRGIPKSVMRLARVKTNCANRRVLIILRLILSFAPFVAGCSQLVCHNDNILSTHRVVVCHPLWHSTRSLFVEFFTAASESFSADKHFSWNEKCYKIFPRNFLIQYRPQICKQDLMARLGFPLISTGRNESRMIIFVHRDRVFKNRSLIALTLIKSRKLRKTKRTMELQPRRRM